jgi:hypothetical protein
MKNNPTREQVKKKKGRIEVQKKTTLESIKHTMGSLKRTRNLGPNPITNSTKQVV